MHRTNSRHSCIYLPFFKHTVYQAQISRWNRTLLICHPIPPLPAVKRTVRNGYDMRNATRSATNWFIWVVLQFIPYTVPVMKILLRCCTQTMVGYQVTPSISLHYTYAVT